MKRKISVVIVMILILSIAVPAFAAITTTEWCDTSGGSSGKCQVKGTLNYFNSSSLGGDYAQAFTESTEKGMIGVRSVIWYTDVKGATSKHSERVLDNATWIDTEKVYVDDGSHGSMATSGHIYSSSEYGSWTKGLKVVFLRSNMTP